MKIINAALSTEKYENMTAEEKQSHLRRMYATRLARLSRQANALFAAIGAIKGSGSEGMEDTVKTLMDKREEILFELEEEANLAELVLGEKFIVHPREW